MEGPSEPGGLLGPSPRGRPAVLRSARGFSLCSGLSGDPPLRPGLCGVGGTFGGGHRLRPFAHHWPLVALTLKCRPVCALGSVPIVTPLLLALLLSLL